MNSDEQPKTIWMPKKGIREMFRAARRLIGSVESIVDLSPNRGSVKMLAFSFTDSSLYAVNADPAQSAQLAAAGGTKFKELAADSTAGLPLSFELGVIRDIKACKPAAAACAAAVSCAYIAVLDSASWRISDLAGQLLRFGLDGVELVRCVPVKTPDMPCKIHMVALFKVVKP